MPKPYWTLRSSAPLVSSLSILSKGLVMRYQRGLPNWGFWICLILEQSQVAFNAVEWNNILAATTASQACYNYIYWFLEYSGYAQQQ